MEIDKTIIRILIDDLFIDLEPAQIGLDDDLRDTVGLDSLGFAELRAQCESTFGVTITDEDYIPENFTSVRTLSDLVLRLSDGAGR